MSRKLAQAFEALANEEPHLTLDDYMFRHGDPNIRGVRSKLYPLLEEGGKLRHLVVSGKIRPKQGQYYPRWARGFEHLAVAPKYPPPNQLVTVSEPVVGIVEIGQRNKVPDKDTQHVAKAVEVVQSSRMGRKDKTEVTTTMASLFERTALLERALAASERSEQSMRELVEARRENERLKQIESWPKGDADLHGNGSAEESPKYQ